MRYSSAWGANEYQLLDASNGERLERWGDYTLIRPDPQVMWEDKARINSQQWRLADARYIRSSSGGGNWEYKKKLPEGWYIRYKGLTFKVKPTGFKHTGVFPEQAVNWDFCDEIIRDAMYRDKSRKINVLNLFAYTGGATLACLNAGANVCHLDAVKGMVEWAKENASLSNLSNNPDKGAPRWIIDDAGKFLAREIKRERKYDAIILDPPSYGRGTNGETWKIEDSINALLLMCTEVLSEKPLFLLMNSYTTGLSPSAVKYLMSMTIGLKYKISVTASEIGIPVKSTGLPLPCGNTTIVRFDN
ncbi:MAG: class I SAM-dependent methyltransferase [Oscillospiraceae bacterium]|nr:class I SAM-dependent methyltransferase [Oscillospiraceae bacterium]